MHMRLWSACLLTHSHPCTAVQDEAKRREALMTKRTALTAKRADLEKAVRELGTLPADAFEKYREDSLPQLHKLLSKAQTQLKKYG